MSIREVESGFYMFLLVLPMAAEQTGLYPHLRTNTHVWLYADQLC